MPESTDSPRLPWRQIIEQATVVEVDGSGDEGTSAG
jgi:hypothetical protein